MSKRVKWIIGILVVLIVVLVSVKAAGIIGKQEGMKVAT
mgnify:CR=1 FL=1